VSRRASVAVSELLLSLDSVYHSAIVAARGNLQLLVAGKIGKLLFGELDVAGEYLGAKLDERIGVRLPASRVPRSFRYWMLDVDLHDPDSMKHAVLWIAKDVPTICFATRNCKKEWGGKTVSGCVLLELVIKSCIAQALQLN